MYSYEQRKKAIETYWGTQSVSETLRVLGYPSSKELYKWIHEYHQNGKLHKKRVKPERIYYTEEEKAAAVQFYHDNNSAFRCLILFTFLPLSGLFAVCLVKNVFIEQ